MALRKGHGAGKAVPLRIEVLPPDELPAPIPAHPVLPARREDGTIADSASAKELGARGGLAKANKKKLLHGMGLAKVSEDNTFHPYYRASQAWLDAIININAAMSGGLLGPGPSACLGNAAICLAMARYLTDKAFETQDELHARQSLRYMDQMKTQLLVSYELGTREAKMRAALTEATALDVFEEALRDQGQPTSE